MRKPAAASACASSISARMANGATTAGVPVKDDVNAEDSALRLYYDGHFGDTIEIHSVGLKGSVKF